MKIPKRLKIGGHLITIDVSKELEGKDGDFSSRENAIRVCKTLPQSQREQTLFHEILHAINPEWDSAQMGHIALESIAQQLYQVLSDNKMLR